MSVYSDAIEIIERDGWHQGASKGPEGGHCILGAISAAVRENPDNGMPFPIFLATNNLSRILRDRPGLEVPGFSVSGWNDDPARTEEDVILLLKEADYIYGDED